MKHLAAYLLLGLGGNTSPSAADVKAVLESVGIEADDDRLNTLISELEGKDISEVRLCPAPPYRRTTPSANSALADLCRYREAGVRPVWRRWWCCPRRCRWRCRC